MKIRMKVGAAAIAIPALMCVAPCSDAQADSVPAPYCSQEYPYPPPSAVSYICTGLGGPSGFGGSMCDPQNPVFTNCPWQPRSNHYSHRR